MAGTACGDHRHYTAGCPACQRITRRYWRLRSTKLAEGTWRHRLDINPVRDHINSLRAHGMSIAAIARAANLSENTVYAAATEKRQWVQGGTGYPILAVKPAPSLPANMVPAAGTTRRVRALIADGYSMAHLGRLLDRHLQLVWEWAWAKHDMVSAASATAVRDLYDRLSEPGPSTRARNMGRRNGWAPPMAWDDATIDDLDATPHLDAEPTAEAVDEVLVRRALTGHARLDNLNQAEQIALWLAWERQRRERLETGPGLKDFARLHGVKTHVVESLRDRAHRTTNTEDNTAADGRTNERSAA